jgi:ATP-dependent HslUV protease ATP-binding subunit HslU
MNASLTPAQVVAELDRYIVGQGKAKRAVAIALRNRWRRQQVPQAMREDITPKNIILIGPTGVGKTEIARRLAKLAGAPFVKVEASRFTEVGYVGRDVESIVRDLVEAAIALVRAEELERVRERALEAAEDRLFALLHGGGRAFGAGAPRLSEVDREKLRAQLRSGTFDDTSVELEVADAAPPPFFAPMGGAGMEDLGAQLKDMFKSLPGAGARTRPRKVKVGEALPLLEREESNRLMDPERPNQEAVRRAQEDGIVFLDEIDKIASREGSKGGGPDVSREGVQRDLLPIVEGSTVNTRYGPVKTDHVLFIAAGAFHVAKPSDLIPELQGRFPIRVELEPLTGADLVRILKEPRNSLVAQYTALLATEGLTLELSDGAIEALAEVAQRVNERSQNIGARRLHTVLERLLDEVSFSASERPGTRCRLEAADVEARLEDLVKDEDLSRYIL